MSLMFAPTLPMPSRDETVALLQFLAANVAVSKEDGEHAKAERYQALHDTAKALSERAVDLAGVSRVVIVTDSVVTERHSGLARYRTFDQAHLYDAGCVIDLQDDGRTLKLLPTPIASEAI